VKCVLTSGRHSASGSRPSRSWRSNGPPARRLYDSPHGGWADLHPACDDQARSTRCACRSCKRERKQPILTERCVHIPDKEVGGDRPAVLHDSALGRFVKLSPSIAVQRDDVSENSNRRDCK
jgi:hypothetical protein